MQSKQLAIHGLNDIGLALARAVLHHNTLQLATLWSSNATHVNQDIGSLLGEKKYGVLINATDTTTTTLLNSNAELVVIADADEQASSVLQQTITALLARGTHVIVTMPDNSLQLDQHAILAACQRGKSVFHSTGVLPHLMLERFAMTLAKALQQVEQVRMLQAIDYAAAPAGFFSRLERLGIGQESASAEHFSGANNILQAVAENVAQQLYGNSTGVRLEHELKTVAAKKNITLHEQTLAKNSIAAVTSIHRAYLNDRCFLVSEEHWYPGDAYAPQSNLPYGNFNTPYRFAFDVSGVPSRLEGQMELAPCAPDTNPLVHIIVQGVLAAIEPLFHAAPGWLLHDATPRYQLDDRMPGQRTATRSKQPSARKYRVVIWGPGEIGGAVTRAALQRDDIELVGAKVFSRHKEGRDLGELVGIAPIGIQATRSTAAILALKPDCVIVTPQPRAIVEGLDNDVLALLEAGINVITSAAYHNVTMPNWLVSSQTPYDLLQEVAATTGMAKNRNEEIAFALNRKLMAASRFGLLKKMVPPVMNKLLQPAIEKAMPFRATPEKIQAACERGNASLHGTGVHPTFMAERVGIQLANWMSDVQHMRFVECADFSFMPDGMWGGLETLGFGKPVDELDEHYLIAKAGDFYYGDVTGNVAHLLFGADSNQVRVERSFRALPAQEDFKVGTRLIRQGTSAALHMTHKGFIGDHHFFTNEECWYLGPNCEYRGDNLPFGNFNTPLSYTIDINGQNQLRFQLSMDGTGRAAELLASGTASADQRCTLGQQMRQEGVTNPITNATAMAILDAVGAVCEMPAGVVIDDIRPGFRTRAADV